MECDIRSEFLNRKTCEDVLDGVVVATSLIEVLKECGWGCAGCGSKGRRMSVQCVKNGVKFYEDFGEGGSGGLEMMGGMCVVSRFVFWRRRTCWNRKGCSIGVGSTGI